MLTSRITTMGSSARITAAIWHKYVEPDSDWIAERDSMRCWRVVAQYHRNIEPFWLQFSCQLLEAAGKNINGVSNPIKVPHLCSITIKPGEFAGQGSAVKFSSGTRVQSQLYNTLQFCDGRCNNSQEEQTACIVVRG